MHTNAVKLPSPTELQLLAILHECGELSGREVAKTFKRETGRSISYGTLYTAFRRLRERQWVHVRDSEDEDGRIRYFKVDSRGAAALTAARSYYSKLSGFGLSMLAT